MLAKAVLVFFTAMLAVSACPLPLVGNDYFYTISVWGSGGPGPPNRESLYDRAYSYLVLPPGGDPGPGWFLPSFDHSVWPVGESAFASIPEVDFNPARTAWAANTDLFLFKMFYKNTWTPTQTLHAKILVAGSYELYLNGALISSGAGDGLANHWDYTVVIPSDKFNAGTNVLGIVARNRGDESGFDFALWSVPEPANWWQAATGVAVLLALSRRASRRKRRPTPSSRP